MTEEGSEVGGEKDDSVDSFCYIGDMLSTEGGSGAAGTARVICALKTLEELAPLMTSKAPSMKMKGQIYWRVLETGCCTGARHGP